MFKKQIQILEKNDFNLSNYNSSIIRNPFITTFDHYPLYDVVC